MHFLPVEEHMLRDLLVFVSVAFACVVWPVGTAADRETQRAQAREPRMRFETMDTNGDGIITRQEWRGSARSFATHDWNGDGKLSGEEVRIGAQRNTRWDQIPMNPEDDRYFSWTTDGFQNLDHNRDGRISRSEWHYDLETFRRVDRNRDDVLSESEFLGVNYDDDRDDYFDDLDVNNNGRVDRSEWHGGTSVFRDLDRNGDGVLSRSEVVGGMDWTD